MGSQPESECRGGRHSPPDFFESEVQGEVLAKHRAEEQAKLRQLLHEAEQPEQLPER
jgi:hypothetical protein